MVALGTNIQPCTLSYIAKYSSSDYWCLLTFLYFTVLKYSFQGGKRIKMSNFSLLIPLCYTEYHPNHIMSMGV